MSDMGGVVTLAMRTMESEGIPIGGHSDVQTSIILNDLDCHCWRSADYDGAILDQSHIFRESVFLQIIMWYVENTDTLVGSVWGLTGMSLIS